MKYNTMYAQIRIQHNYKWHCKVLQTNIIKYKIHINIQSNMIHYNIHTNAIQYNVNTSDIKKCNIDN